MGAKRLSSILILATVLLPLIVYSVSAQETDVADTTHIFFSAGCANCWPYTEEVLLPTLHAKGLAAAPEVRDYRAPDGRGLLLEVADTIELSRSIADSLYADVSVGYPLVAIKNTAIEDRYEPYS